MSISHQGLRWAFFQGQASDSRQSWQLGEGHFDLLLSPYPFLSPSLAGPESPHLPVTQISNGGNQTQARCYRALSLALKIPRLLPPASQLYFRGTRRLPTQKVPVRTVVKAKNSFS